MSFQFDSVIKYSEFWISISVATFFLFSGLFSYKMILNYEYKQPLWKKSPKLLALSVIGNSLCIVSVFIIQSFQKVKQIQLQNPETDFCQINKTLPEF